MKNSVSDSVKEEVLMTLDQNLYQKVCKELDSRYKLEKFVEAKFNFVELQDICNRHGTSVGKYASIQKTISYILQDQTFLRSRKNSSNGNIQYITDAEILKVRYCLSLLKLD